MKSFKNFLKSLGRKAIGFVRGLNGKKAASVITSVVGRWKPAAGLIAAPFEESVAETINKGLASAEEYLKPDEDKPREPTEMEKRLIAAIRPTENAQTPGNLLIAQRLGIHPS